MSGNWQGARLHKASACARGVVEESLLLRSRSDIGLPSVPAAGRCGRVRGCVVLWWESGGGISKCALHGIAGPAGGLALLSLDSTCRGVARVAFSRSEEF